jgi:hypothetical protein
MVRFVDEDEIDTRYWEKPYYLVPDGDEADEGYSIMRDALAETRKVAIGQLIMHGREHLVGIKALGRGLVLSILRYPDELRDPKPYFEHIRAEQKPEAVRLATELIEAESGGFEPEKLPDTYAKTLRELLRAKVEQRAHQIEVAPEGKAQPEVINIMAALKESMQAKGRGTRCAAELASPRKRGSKGQERHDNQARVEQRIEQATSHYPAEFSRFVVGDCPGSREKFVPIGRPRFRIRAGPDECSGWPAQRSRSDSCAMVSPIDMRGSQLIGLNLVMWHRGQ